MAVELLGVGAATLALFVGFGVLVGVLFGFFGMGGSFLVTPALLVMGYPSRVAVGSGLAFVFGTSVIGALRHRDLGQVDYRLAALLTVSVSVGIEFGKRAVLSLEALGAADLVVSVAYVVLLGAVGAFVVVDARREGDPTGSGAVLARVRLPPTVSILDGPTVSVWVVFAIGLVVGVLAGFLGVGGGFLLMPAMLYGLGVPAAVAVGTDILQITISGAVGSFLYAQSGGVDLSIVAPLLAGSALGARVGSAATGVVSEDDIKGYFGAMLLLGAVAVAIRQVGLALGTPALSHLSLAIIVGSALLVSGAVCYSSLLALRRREEPRPASTD
ncbi:sulfite exporter TauE/SafE family protein [Halomarina ordinaria]|uniref:Probable membrane transporter protein n=1 Tax=Halomarina ordinaria TaxID=3033939 RepID=A0ABD5UD35_9EURY|nr:sulfite exporter TauE/SafE family protein [Halomarina sp. PSRA2]